MDLRYSSANFRPPPRRFAVLLALTALGVPRSAMATCTSPIDGATSCVGGYGVDVCARGGTTWSCDLRDGGVSASTAQGYAVYDGAGDWCTAGNYCAFGVDTTGTSFCCEENPSPATIRTIRLSGTLNAAGDVLGFIYTSGAVTHQLEPTLGVPLSGQAFGYAGADTIRGSDSVAVAPPYLDFLDGGTDDDLILAGSGFDYLYGGTGLGMDELRGGPDDDELQCGGDNDVGWGDSGNDALYGDAGSEFLDGGTGADQLFGGPSDDVLCGGNTVAFDELMGAGELDRLWLIVGSPGTENAGPPFTDYCSFNGSLAALCDFVQTTNPCL